MTKAQIKEHILERVRNETDVIEGHFSAVDLAMNAIDDILKRMNRQQLIDELKNIETKYGEIKNGFSEDE